MNNKLIKKSFIHSLFHVCTLKNLSDIINCDDDNIIYIHNIEEFKKNILPIYFYNIKWNSFTRHLNNYKFTIQTIQNNNIKMKKFYNKLFNINDISCIELILNKYNKKNRLLQVKKNSNYNNFYIDMSTYDIKKYISNIKTDELISMPLNMKNMVKSMEILIDNIDNIDNNILYLPDNINKI